MAYYSMGTLIFFVYFIKWFLRRLEVLRFSKVHGCKLPARLPQLERVIGFGLYKTQISVSKQKTSLATSYERYQKHGNTWSGQMMGKTFYNTIDIENLKSILATDFKDYGLGERLEAFGPFLGKGIFTSDGAQWEHSRALVRPNFTKAQVADLDELEPHIQRMISKIPKDGSTVDLQPLFFQLTLDSSTNFLFGQSVNSLTSTEGSENYHFGQAFDLAQGRLPNRVRLGKLIRLKRDLKFQEACNTVHQFVDKIISEALEKTDPCDMEKSIGGTGEKQRYIFLTEMIKETRDPKQLRDELLNILLAGRDTTASLLSNTFHVLARRPDIWTKLQAEVDELGGEAPDYETLRNMKYLKNILNESLRLYPVVPVNGRFANKDTFLPRGGGIDGQSPVFISKGSIAAWHTYAMHRRTDIYGPDALEFRPERWNAEEGLRPGWAYLPFNGGPRICVGQMFALTSASYTIVRLVQAFAELIDRDGSEWVEQLSLTVCSAKGVQVAMMPRA